MAGKRTIACGFGLYGLAALAGSAWLLHYALVGYAPEGGRTGDVVGPPDMFWRVLVGGVVGFVALVVLGLGAVNIAAGRAILREQKATVVHVACRLDALAWALYLLVALVAFFGLGEDIAPPIATAGFFAALLVPVHLVLVRPGRMPEAT